MKCKEMVEAENEQIEGEEYVNEGDPSILRFLLASRDEVINLFHHFYNILLLLPLISIIFLLVSSSQASAIMKLV